ncbi:hypothetical protein PSTT_01239 [Puccinia striiformis]|uniref:Uncharacterized protein n=1 Tax=Puccinia striiformis TaxID=27350 RepID=A0A2S4W3W1_9BASI|nr:hypothetical protein PSTT_01239 [Puccinia striiformis]
MSSGNRPALNSGGDHLAASTEQHQSTRSPTSTPSFDSPDEDDEIDPKFVVRSAKSMIKAKKQRKKEQTHSNKVATLSTSADLPHHRSKLSLSITNFVKGMIGCARTNFKLPLPPSNKEFQQGESWLQRRQDAMDLAIDEHSQKAKAKTDSERSMMIRNQSQQLKNELPPVIFKPAPTSDFNIPKPFQIACNDEFKTQGFSRITFEWKKPESKWNSAATTILAKHWYNFYLQERSFSKLDEVNARPIIERWLKTMKKKYAQDNNPKSKAAPADAEEEQRAKEDSAMRRRHRDRRGQVGWQIAKMRFATSMSCFPEHPHISVIFNNVDTVSDYEDSTSIEHDPRSILLTWRSNDLNEFVALIDKATTQKAKSKDRHKISAILSRNGTRQPTEEEEEMYPIPEGLPRDSYSDKILVASSEIEREAMGIPATEDNRFSLSQAVAELKKRTAYTLISAAATNHNTMQVDFMNANQ